MSDNNLRVPDDSFPGIKDAKITLIRIGDGEPQFAATTREKREIMTGASPDAIYIAVWKGEWRSDAFSVSPSLRDQWMSDLGLPVLPIYPDL